MCVCVQQCVGVCAQLQPRATWDTPHNSHSCTQLHTKVTRRTSTHCAQMVCVDSDTSAGAQCGKGQCKVGLKGVCGTTGAPPSIDGTTTQGRVPQPHRRRVRCTHNPYYRNPRSTLNPMVSTTSPNAVPLTRNGQVKVVAVRKPQTPTPSHGSVQLYSHCAVTKPRPHPSPATSRPDGP